MATCGNSEQATIPVKHEAQNAPRKESSPDESLTIQDIFIATVATLGACGIINFITPRL